MTLRDDIFPTGPPRDGRIIRAQLVETWESQLLGLGRLTAFLTARLEKESFAIDDMALYVVFLQRHRVEVGLKLILERTGASIPTTHKLEPLLQSCKNAVEAAGFSSEWQRFSGAQASFVQLVGQIDPGAATFRYPVDTAEQPWSRDEYVDLEEFERAGARFQASLLELIEDLASLEPLPVDVADAETVARELRGLSRACRRMADVSDNMLSQLRTQGPLAASTLRSAGTEGGLRAFDAVQENNRDIAARADRMRVRVENTYSIALEPEPPNEPMPVVPTISFALDRRVVAAQARAVMKAVADAMIAFLPPLSAAIEAVETRSETWSTPYARQIHNEVARLRSRMFKFHLAGPTTIDSKGGADGERRVVDG